MLGEEEPITAQRLAQQLKDILPAEGALKDKWSQITELKTRKENELSRLGMNTKFSRLHCHCS